MDMTDITDPNKITEWHLITEVWHFDRSKGFTNLGKKAKPSKTEPVSLILKELYDNFNNARNGQDPQSVTETSLSLLPKDFCKKDTKTGIQKQLKCLACKCLIECTNALKSHLQSAKHIANVLHLTQKKIDIGTKISQNCDKHSLETLTLPSDKYSSKREQNSSFPQDKPYKRRKVESKGDKNKRITDRPGYGQEKYDETSYYFDPVKKLRRVYPYYFTFTTFSKGRWVGETIYNIFSREFRAHSPEEYRRSIEAGSLTVNGNQVEPEYVLQHNDMLANIVHRHEVPVTSDDIEIIHMDSDLVVVDKPPSIPVHPCGRYRHNTVAYILAKEKGLRFLKTIHRLDRLTSGVLMFGKTAEKAHEMEQQIRSRTVRKVYVCRVEGEFPNCQKYQETSSESVAYSTNGTKGISCLLPIEVVSHKIGVCRVSLQGKPCQTDFERLSYNGKTSVVLCRPHTGRMHQIRVHLQYLGYPIVNDPLYNSIAFGPLKGKGGDIGGKNDQELINELIRLHSAENWVDSEMDNCETSTPKTFHSTDSSFKEGHAKNNGDLGLNAILEQPDIESKYEDTVKGYKNDRPIEPETLDSHSKSSNDKKLLENAATTPGLQNLCQIEMDGQATSLATSQNPENIEVNYIQNVLDKSKLIIDPGCKECSMNFSDPTPEELVMYLHAYKYSGDNWSFETKLPKWADENWIA